MIFASISSFGCFDFGFIFCSLFKLQCREVHSILLRGNAYSCSQFCFQPVLGCGFFWFRVLLKFCFLGVCAFQFLVFLSCFFNSCSWFLLKYNKPPILSGGGAILSEFGLF